MIDESLQPEQTILITAHNEADNIQSCLHAILEQDYPMERVEILLVDDRSTDGTAERARAMGIALLRVIRIDEAPPENLTSRQAALDLGFREARGEIVLVTDAGGRVPREWIRELTGHLGYRDGAITGPVIFAGGQPFLARYQTINNLVDFALLNRVNRRGKAAGLLGANMAVRREAYLETGGFPVIGFALAEDLALGQALHRTGWSIRYLLEPAALKPACKSLNELISRARRRATNLSPAMRRINLSLIVTNVILILGAVLWGQFWLFLLLVRYAIGLLAVGLTVTRYAETNSLHWIWIYEPMMTLVGLWVHLSNLLVPRWKWGGLQYDRPAPEPAPTDTQIPPAA